MPGLLALPVACSALMCGAVDQGQIAADLAPPQTPAVAATTATSEPSGTVQLVELQEFAGGSKYVETAERLHNLLLNPGAFATGPAQVQLVQFDGGREFLKASRRLRVWRSHVAYTLSVDAQGKAVDCELTNAFRKTYVNQKLCDVLLKSHTFEPARTAENVPVEGVYTATLSYMDLREQNP
ncbi:MAG: hypothetical protein SXU28_12365 [Pseudomonadota bacterium]|nr:hypothetical protein [Pseudomonadota bacterium]